MKKIHCIIIISLVVAGILLFFFWPKHVEEKNATVPAEKSSVKDVSSIPISTKEPKTMEIVYTDNGFNPAVLIISSGDTVIFKNESNGGFQPSNDLNAKNGSYPGFGATTTISKNKQYEFTFKNPGEYGYYNFLKQKFFGAIVVK